MSQEASVAKRLGYPPYPVDWKCPSTDPDPNWPSPVALSDGSHPVAIRDTAFGRPEHADMIPCEGNVLTYVGTKEETNSID